MDLDAYPLFAGNKATLRETSKDDSTPENVQYMTDETALVVDFDMVKRRYVNALGLSEDCASSVDALRENGGRMELVEFKNGKVNNRSIKDKARDSLLLFCDITGKGLSYTRGNVDFIVVYNAARNPLPRQAAKGQTQFSPSRTAIGEHFAAKAKKELILFDLERYERLYFRRVHTYSKERFASYLAEQA